MCIYLNLLLVDKLCLYGCACVFLSFSFSVHVKIYILSVYFWPFFFLRIYVCSGVLSPYLLFFSFLLCALWYVHVYIYVTEYISYISIYRYKCVFSCIFVNVCLCVFVCTFVPISIYGSDAFIICALYMCLCVGGIVL